MSFTTLSITNPIILVLLLLHSINQAYSLERICYNCTLTSGDPGRCHNNPDGDILSSKCNLPNEFAHMSSLNVLENNCSNVGELLNNTVLNNKNLTNTRYSFGCSKKLVNCYYERQSFRSQRIDLEICKENINTTCATCTPCATCMTLPNSSNNLSTCFWSLSISAIMFFILIM